MEQTKTVELNQQEANALLQIIDVAVKAQGMSAAEAGVHLTKKIQEAFSAEEPEEVTPEAAE